MPEDKNLTLEMLLDEITNLKSEVNSLKTENVALKKNVEDVVAVNRKLLSAPNTPTEVDDDEAKKKLYKFLKGE